MSGQIQICRYIDVRLTRKQADEIDRIFFESSNTKSFASDAARAAFRERWLGRYLVSDPAFAYLALERDAVVGYLVGAINDPVLAARFSDILDFVAFAEQAKRFPAHLHVNVSPAFRNRGIGGRLIAHFIADAKAAGAPGLHVVTSEGADNVRFYARNGFREVARGGPGDALVFLAQAL